MGKITLITGTMFSGKTTKLISILEELRKNNIFNYSVYRDVPIIVDGKIPCIVSHNNWCFPTQKLFNLNQLRNDKNKYIFIDSVQRLNKEFINLILEKATNSEQEFYLAGIRSDFEGKEYETMSTLFTYSDEIILLKTKCEKCNKNAIYNIPKKETNINLYIDKTGKDRQNQLLCRDCFIKKNLNQ